MNIICCDHFILLSQCCFRFAGSFTAKQQCHWWNDNWNYLIKLISLCDLSLHVIFGLEIFNVSYDSTDDESNTTVSLLNTRQCCHSHLTTLNTRFVGLTFCMRMESLQRNNIAIFKVTAFEHICRSLAGMQQVCECNSLETDVLDSVRQHCLDVCYLTSWNWNSN